MKKQDDYRPGIYIPYEVIVKDITPLAKILYGVLAGFQSFEKEGVWATRRTLAGIVNCSQQRITEMVKILADEDLIFFNGYKVVDSGQKIRLLKRRGIITLVHK